MDIGGTLIYDAIAARLHDGKDRPAAGVVTLHHRYVDQLFCTGSGTSYAAPLVARKAAQILVRFPGASANLVRALLAAAADIPEAARRRLSPLGDDATHKICGHGQVDELRASYSDDHRVVLYAQDELPIDHFAVYQVPMPEPFQSGGKRSIRVTLAFDPPVRHTRADYMGVKMSFRLIRGCDPALVFEYFRKRTQEEGAAPDMQHRFKCELDPKSTVRERGTLQRGSKTFSTDTSRYGDTYLLVVRCEGGWASAVHASQRFAVVVELTHQAQVQLYERLRARVRLGA